MFGWGALMVATSGAFVAVVEPRTKAVFMATVGTNLAPQEHTVHRHVANDAPCLALVAVFAQTF